MSKLSKKKITSKDKYYNYYKFGRFEKSCKILNIKLLIKTKYNSFSKNLYYKKFLYSSY